jgi:hypothetical protein
MVRPSAATVASVPAVGLKGSSSHTSSGKLKLFVFLLAVVAVFTFLPLRHMNSAPAHLPPRKVHTIEDQSAAPPDDDGDLLDGTQAIINRSVVSDPRYSREQMEDMHALGIQLNWLSASRVQFHDPIELRTLSERGGAFRNPYRPMKRTAAMCSDNAHTMGEWVFNASRLPPYPSVGLVLGSCQRGWEAGHGRGSQRPETKYQWKPESCELIPFSEELFCKALRGRDILFAGDSLTDHWHASLLYLLGVSRGRDIYRREGTGKKCVEHKICSRYYKDGRALYFVNNQLLEQTFTKGKNRNWWKRLPAFGILVLNSGSWMRYPNDKTREVTDELWKEHMLHARRIVRALFNGTVIWRTAYQGHPDCWNYDEPLKAELSSADFPTVDPYRRYRWDAIPGRNVFVTELWREAGGHILDVTRPTNLMPLGHLGKNHPQFASHNATDCLHYCAPGPYDLWSQLLMNLLLGNLGDA